MYPSASAFLMIFCFYGVGLSHVAEVDGAAFDLDKFLVADQQVVSGYAEGAGILCLEQLADVLIDDFIEGVFHDDLNRGSIGHRAGVFETCFDFGFFECPRNGFASVNDDDFNACGVEESDIGGDAGAHCGVGVVHEGTAVFDHEDGIPEALDIGEALPAGRLLLS